MTLSLLFSITFSLYAQKKETEFWLTFGQNFIASYTSVDLQIRIVSGEHSTTGCIYFTNLGTSDSVTFSIGAYEVFTHPLTNTQKQAVYNTTMGKSNKSIYIKSSDPIKVHVLNQRPVSTDATSILPIEILNNNYYQISYTVSINNYPDAYAVVAIENNTELFHNGISIDTLNIGEVYYKTSATDMTGAHITATHPIAFFALHNSTTIPTIYGSQAHLMQQLASVNTWGKNFFVPVSHLTKDRVRIVASQNSTTIQTDGIFIYSSSGNYVIDAGEYIELEVHLMDSGCYIQTDKPVGVCTYLTGATYNGLQTSAPAKAWLPPVEQFVYEALIAPFIPTGDTRLNDHRALVVTPTALKDSTKVSIGGGAPTALSGTWYNNETEGMSFYNMPLTNPNASYYFTNPKGLIVMGYGTGLAESYYYLAGSAMRELDAAFYANDIHFQELEENPFCEKEITFRAELDNMGIDVDSIKWYINNEEYVPAQNSLEWSKTFEEYGVYKITMWVRFENDSIISKTGTLKIKNCNFSAVFYVNNVHHLYDTTFCEKNVDFRAEIEGEYEELKWFINGDEHVPANPLQWSRDFVTGTYNIDMRVCLANGEEETIAGILKMEVLWIKIKNVRH